MRAGVSGHLVPLGLTTAIFACRLVLAIVVVPPWQNPDEPGHFARVRILARQARLDLTEVEDHAMEAEILRSMAEHDWWESYDRKPPDPLPAHFSDPAVVQNVARQSDAPPLYYLIGAWWVRLFGVTDLLAQYGALRWLSLLLAVPTLWCAWAGTRRLFGEHVALGATAVMALHPQFALIAIAVNADVLVNLCGAVLWWQAARLLAGPGAVSAPVMILGVAAAAALSKRLGASLLILAALVIALVIARQLLSVLSGRFGRRVVVRAALAAALVALAAIMGTAYWAVTKWPWLLTARALPNLGELIGQTLHELGRDSPRLIGGLAHYWSEVMALSFPEHARGSTFFWSFHEVLFDSAWFSAGWLRYPAPFAWRLAIRSLALLSVCGLVFAMLRRRGLGDRFSYLVAVLIVIVQAAGIYVGFYLSGFGGQGRYLFPVIGPWMALYWVGLRSWWSDASPTAFPALVAVMLALDLVAWSVVLIPEYIH